MAGRRRGGFGLGLLLAASLLVACGGEDDERAGPSDSAGPTTDTAPGGTEPPLAVPSPQPPPSIDTELRDLAEGLAGETRIPPRSEPVLGGDVSWPQCPPGMGIPQKRSHGGPMPVPEAEYVIVGLTNGPGFTPNPCLADQVDWVRERELMIAAYAVLSYPDAQTLAALRDEGPYEGGDRLGALRNVGYQQALFNLESMREADFPSPVVWLDVEPVPDFDWSGDPVANAAVVEGNARAYRDAGYEIGVYSTTALWRGIVGDFTLGVPEWRAAGQTSGAEALARCGEDRMIQGGPAVMGQWVEAERDMNWTCPGISADLGRWFHAF